MAVDDHGLEVLKKAGNDATGEKKNYRLQTILKDENGNDLLSVSSENELLVRNNLAQQIKSNKLLIQLLKELKTINVHLAYMSGMDIDKKELN